MLIPPALPLVLLLILLSAALLHAALGRSLRELGLLILAAAIGFVLGEALARAQGHSRFMLGPVHLLQGLAGAWLAMGLALGLLRRRGRGGPTTAAGGP